MKRLIKLFLVVSLTFTFSYFLLPEKTNANTALDSIYVLMGNEAGTLFCCCPGTQDCGAACCPGC